MEELPLLNELYNSYYRSSRPIGEARWLYADNPNGSAVIYAAFDDDGRLAGMRPSIPFRLCWSGQERMAYEFADALVHPRHQGKGIFSRLVKMTCEWAEQEGCTLFSLPNENSLAVYRRSPGLQILGESRAQAKALSWTRYVHHHLTRRRDRARAASDVEAPDPVSEAEVCLRPVERFASDFSDVRAQLQGSLASFTLRTREFLQWRYFGCPARNYRVALIEDRGRVRGYLVIRVISGIAYLVDVFLWPDARLARRAFRLAAKWARRMDAMAIHFNSAGNDFFQAAAAQGGYWLNKRSRPLVIDGASTRDLARRKERTVSMADVYFVMGDFDFF